MPDYNDKAINKQIKFKSWASPENVRTMGLFFAMVVGTYGIGNTTVGTLDRSLREVRGELHGIGNEVTELRAEMEMTRNALDNLRAGTVNTSNLSRIVAITRAIGDVDRDDSTLWTAKGKPRISALEVLLKATGRMDYKITATERDHACAISAQCRR